MVCLIPIPSIPCQARKVRLGWVALSAFKGDLLNDGEGGMKDRVVESISPIQNLPTDAVMPHFPPDIPHLWEPLLPESVHHLLKLGLDGESET